MTIDYVRMPELGLIEMLNHMHVHMYTTADDMLIQRYRKGREKRHDGVASSMWHRYIAAMSGDHGLYAETSNYL